MKVNVIIVNHNGWLDTVECLESVLKSENVDINVYVVDNSIDDESLKNIKNWALGNYKVEKTLFQDIIIPNVPKPLKYIILSEGELKERENVCDFCLVKANENRGFAAANNIILEYISVQEDESYIFLLNNDTVIERDTISKMINKYEQESNIGIAGGILLEYENPDRVQSLGGKYYNFFGFTKQVYEGQHISTIPYGPKLKIDYPAGAAMFLSSTVLNDIGTIFDKYFLFFEELDWVKSGGDKYKTSYLEECFIYHKGGMSVDSKNKSYLSDKFSILNRIKYAKRHNKKYMVTVYLGIILTILKRMVFVNFSHGFKLLRDLNNYK